MNLYMLDLWQSDRGCVRVCFLISRTPGIHTAPRSNHSTRDFRTIMQMCFSTAAMNVSQAEYFDTLTTACRERQPALQLKK